VYGDYFPCMWRPRLYVEVKKLTVGVVKSTSCGLPPSVRNLGAMPTVFFQIKKDYIWRQREE
jgi:hypothetical protein